MSNVKWQMENVKCTSAPADIGPRTSDIVFAPPALPPPPFPAYIARAFKQPLSRGTYRHYPSTKEDSQ